MNINQRKVIPASSEPLEIALACSHLYRSIQLSLRYGDIWWRSVNSIKPGRHLLPNVLGPLLVQISVDIPRAVEAEASLSFLGLGVAVTTPSLGLSVAPGYQYLFSGVWWPSVLPGLALVLSVLSENLIGDWVRYALDPRAHGRGRVARVVRRRAAVAPLPARPDGV